MSCFDGGMHNPHSALEAMALAAAMSSKVSVEGSLNGLGGSVLQQPGRVLPCIESPLAVTPHWLELLGDVVLGLSGGSSVDSPLNVINTALLCVLVHGSVEEFNGCCCVPIFFCMVLRVWTVQRKMWIPGRAAFNPFFSLSLSPIRQ